MKKKTSKEKRTLVIVMVVTGLLLVAFATIFSHMEGKKSEVQKSGDTEQASGANSDAPSLFHARKVLCLLATQSSLYASVEGEGVFRSDDGNKWRTLRLGMNEPRSALSLAEVRPTRETLSMKLMDETASGAKPPDQKTVEKVLTDVAKIKPGLLAGFADGHILRLEGDRFTEVSKLPADGGGVFKLRFHPALGLAACTGRGLYFSIDAGLTWRQVTTDVLTRDVLLGIDKEQRFLVGSYGGGLSRCTLKGSCRSLGAMPKMVRALSGDQAAQAGFVATDGDGLWKFEGDKLTQISSNALDNADILDIDSTGARVIAAAGPDGVIIRETPEAGWYPGSNLPPDSVNSVAVFAGRVFVGTNRYGLFSAPLGSSRFEAVSF